MSLRSTNLVKLQNQTFDALIIGGGINGAVVAAALAAQGAKVALLEQKDFASGTSQESSNLVWGGIKYLESGDLALVRKLCLSRNQLLQAYPSTVKEIRFFATLKKSFRKSRWLLYAGAWLYWFMGNGKTKPPRLLSNQIIAKEEPLIAADDSKGGIEYSDCYLYDNDARFVFNFIRQAMDHGAVCANYCQVLGAQRMSQGLWHVQALDAMNGTSLAVASRILINAAGPYADQVNELNHVVTSFQHVFSKGIHLLVPRLSPKSDRVLTFFADDGRLFFVIPMGTRSCIGTTDTKVQSLPTVVTDDDRAFVLNNINRLLKIEPALTTKDIIAERCGVRPLVVKRDVGEAKPQSAHQDWTSLSRKHVVEVNFELKHISIFGGKLTDCLNIGQEVAKVAHGLGIKLPFYGHRWFGEPPRAVRDAFMHQARLMDLDGLTHPSSSEPLSQRLWRRYGRTAFELLEDIRVDPQMAAILIEGAEYIRCEIFEAARKEMVVNLSDFLRRRSKIALVTPHHTLKANAGLREACRILFPSEDADAKFRDYFAFAESEGRGGVQSSVFANEANSHAT